ncbi:MAG: hypothetical protein ACYC4R_09830 [Anaerolineae bacterium]
MRRIRSLLLIALFGLALAGCAPFVSQDQPGIEKGQRITLAPGGTAGQALTTQHAGLNGLEVYIEAGEGIQGALRLSLHAASDRDVELAAATWSVPAEGYAGYARFAFAPLQDSHRADYFAALTWEGNGNLTLGAAGIDAYMDGTAYADDEPLAKQLAFRTLFDVQSLLIGAMGSTLGQWGLVLGAGLLLFVLPGLALLRLLWPRDLPLGALEALGMALGLGIVVYPILVVWTGAVGLHLGRWNAWLPVLASAAVLIWRDGRRLPAWRPRVGAWWRSDACAPNVAFWVVAALVFATRFASISSLDVPMWGDSVHHTLITRLLVDHGGLFDSWEPYSALQSFTYHLGFHTNAAAFQWLTGVDSAQAVLLTGQLFNVMAVVALYPLTMRLGGNRWAGVCAMLVGGLLAQMPMFYVNWGRYTQLAGQVTLPALVCLLWAAFRSPRLYRGLTLLVCLAFGGLALIHYRVAAFGIIVFGVLVAIRLFSGGLKSAWRLFAPMVLGSIVLALPWYLRVASGSLYGILGNQLSPALETGMRLPVAMSLGNLADFLPPLLWLLAAPAAAYGLWRRERGVALLGLWWFGVALAAYPQWLSLPGQGALTDFAVYIAAYLPVGVLLGLAAGWLAGRWATGWRCVLALLLVGVLGLWGARQRLGDFSVRDNSMVTRADLRAAAWIRENTPEKAFFLVNETFAYEGTMVVGTDAGWWLPYLTGRQATLPPMPYASELGPTPAYAEDVNALRALLDAQPIGSDEVVAELRRRGVTHVYIGEWQRPIANATSETLDPGDLVLSAAFQVVYRQDAIWIFALLPE